MTTPPQDDRPQDSSGWTPPTPGGSPAGGPPSFDKPAYRGNGPEEAPTTNHPAYPGPSGYPPYPGMPTALEPVASLGRAAIGLAVAITVVSGLGALAAFGDDPQSTLSLSDALSGLVGLLWVASFVVTGLWLARVRRNSEHLAPTYHHARSRGWVWAGWLVPIVNFWFPYQVVRDAVSASAGAVASRPERASFGLWWGAWLVGQLASTSFSGDLAIPALVGTVNLVGVIALIASLRAWIKIVRTANQLQAAAG